MTGYGRGIGFAILAASIYGLVPNVARLAFDQGIPALESVVVRTLTVIVVLSVTALLLKNSFKVEAAARVPLVLQIIATILVSSCYIASIQFVPVSVSVLMFFTFPVVIALAAPIVEGRSYAWGLIGCAVLAFAGLALAVGPEIQSLDVRGLVLAGLASLGCALQFFSGRMMAGKIKPDALGALVHLAVLPVVMIIMFLTNDGTTKLLSSSTSTGTLLVVSLVGVFYCAAYFCQMSSVAYAPSSVVAPYFNIEPVVTTGIAVLLLGETMTYLHMIGGSMIIMALIATNLLESRVQGNG